LAAVSVREPVCDLRTTPACPERLAAEKGEGVPRGRADRVQVAVEHDVD
jgi:hypothetical protein